MNKIIKSLKICPLFESCEEESIGDILKSVNYKLLSYSKMHPVAIEEEACASIGIIIDGGVDIQKLYASGKAVTLNSLREGDIFGEAIIFSGTGRYPATIVSNDNTSIIFISRDDIVKLCRINTKFLHNFMSLLSNKILMLNRKIKNLSFQTIRQKISNYLFEEWEKQKKPIIKLYCTRREMADYLGIPRPSLSRELVNMKKDGIIDFDRDIFKIIDYRALEESLM